MNRCRRGHEHATWDAAVRCSFDTVSARDDEGRLIEDATPAADVEAQEQPMLDFDREAS